MPRTIQIAEPPPRIPVQVRSVEVLGDEVYRIVLESPFNNWQPGDCIAVYAPGENGISRPYSLCGSSTDPNLELWVRRFSGGQISDFLCGCRKGDVVQVSPPFGYFRPAKPEEADKIYFATGTGIAPFLSAIRSGAALPRQLYWGLRKPWGNLRPFDGLSPTLAYSQSGHAPGRITQFLPEVSFSDQTHFYACGLDRMIEEVLGYFSNSGVEDSRLHRECFFTSA